MCLDCVKRTPATMKYTSLAPALERLEEIQICNDPAALVVMASGNAFCSYFVNLIVSIQRSRLSHSKH